MDNLKERTDKEDMEKAENTRSIVEYPRTRKGARQSVDRGALIYTLLFFALGVLFSRCHLIFGARALALSYICVLPMGVMPASLGAVIGALTLGREGILYAIVASLAVFLRVIISGIGADSGVLFNEKLLLRMSSAAISGFFGAVYEILTEGFSHTALLFGITMVVLPPLLTFLFSGIFSTGMTLPSLVCGTGNIFSLSRKKDTERYNIIFFQISALAAMFFVSLSLASYSLFGISVSYVFTSFMTLLSARRFGALRAMAVGFVLAVGLSGIDAVGFGLAGLCSGVLFNFGIGFGVVSAVAAVGVWSSYASGLTGLLGVLPEAVIASALSIPLLRGIRSERTSEETCESERSASEMVGTMALTYRLRSTRNMDILESSLSSIASVIKRRTPSRIELSPDEYAYIVSECSDRFCRDCASASLCESEGIDPCRKNAAKIAEKLQRGERIGVEDVNTDTEFCRMAERLADDIMRAAARAECESFRLRESGVTAEEYELIAKLISEAREADERERCMNAELGDRLSTAIAEAGYSDWVIRAFGERRVHLIIAGEDRDGLRIVAPELRSAIEKCADIKLGASEFFRRGSMALMECDARKKYVAECAFISSAADRREVSGDTAVSFESDTGKFYALISDGMGRGENARRASEFVTEYLSRALSFGASKDTVLHLLNRSMRRGRDECSATVDLFELDLYKGDAMFIKSGSAPSYIKRDNSIFRIKSETAPIGLMSNIDTERIRVEVKPSDLIIMLSDGVSQSSEDAAWLLELLSQPMKRESLSTYAERILTLAKQSVTTRDDMTVGIVRIGETE